MSDEPNDKKEDDGLWWLRDLTPGEDKKTEGDSPDRLKPVARRVLRDFRRTDDDAMSKTQPSRPVRRESVATQTPKDQTKTEDKKTESEPQNPKFGLGSLGFLLFVVWAAQTLGLTFPGPVDDYIWDLIGSLFFGLVQVLRLKFPIVGKLIKLKSASTWQNFGKKYPKFANRLSYYFGGAEDQFEEEYE